LPTRKSTPAKKTAASSENSASSTRKPRSTAPKTATAKKSAAPATKTAVKKAKAAAKKPVAAKKPASGPVAGEDSPYRQLALAAANAALDKLAIEPVLIDLSGSQSYTDYLLVASAQSSRAVRGIAEHIEAVMSERGVRTLGKEGLGDGNWALVDFGDVVVHIMDQKLRTFYDLEGLWFDAPRIPLKIPPELLLKNQPGYRLDDEDSDRYPSYAE
jgi:ribosome-associated protein